jgi:hypothetical protein
MRRSYRASWVWIIGQATEADHSLHERKRKPPPLTWSKRRGQINRVWSEGSCDRADVARNGLQEKVKRNGCNETRRSFEQRAGFLRKRNCGLYHSTVEQQ